MVPGPAQRARSQSHSSRELNLNDEGLAEWTPVCPEPRVSWGPRGLPARRSIPVRVWGPHQAKRRIQDQASPEIPVLTWPIPVQSPG